MSHDSELIKILKDIDPSLGDNIILHNKITVKAKPKPRRYRPWPKN